MALLRPRPDEHHHLIRQVTKSTGSDTGGLPPVCGEKIGGSSGTTSAAVSDVGRTPAPLRTVHQACCLALAAARCW